MVILIYTFGNIIKLSVGPFNLMITFGIQHHLCIFYKTEKEMKIPATRVYDHEKENGAEGHSSKVKGPKLPPKQPSDAKGGFQRGYIQDSRGRGLSKYFINVIFIAKFQHLKASFFFFLFSLQHLQLIFGQVAKWKLLIIIQRMHFTTDLLFLILRYFNSSSNSMCVFHLTFPLLGYNQNVETGCEMSCRR